MFAISKREASRSLYFNYKKELCAWQNNKTGEQKIVNKYNSINDKWNKMSYDCVAMFNYEIFDQIKNLNLGDNFSLMDVYIKLASTNKILGISHRNNKFIDVGKPDSICIAEKLFI